MSFEYELWTDGGFNWSSGKGAFAFVLLRVDGLSKSVVSVERELLKENATCNRAEFLGFIKGVEYLFGSHDDVTFVRCYSDSSLLVNTFNSWMHKWLASPKKFEKKKNQDLVLRLYELHTSFGSKIKLSWVKGHSGLVYNELCDKLCNELIGH